MSSPLARTLKFRPASYKTQESMGYIVEFYVYDPSGDQMVRQRYRINKYLAHCTSKRERNREAQRIADEITARLANGWSPLTETESPRLMTPFDTLRKKYLDQKKREGLRPATLQSYSSITNIFVEYTKKLGNTKHSGFFLREDAIIYMDHIRDKGNSNRNYNNTVKQLRTFFAWALEHCYCKENPFDGIRLMTKEAKKRELIDADSRTRIDAYLADHCPQYLLFLRLVYTAQLRPKEALCVRLGWIDIERHCIVIPGEVAKNGKTRCAAFTPEIESYLMQFAQLDPDLFLFGKGESMLPNKVAAASSTPRHKWDRLREVLSLPKEMQMYSFRDTGIIDMEHAGIDQLTVQHHSDHSSLNVQRIYTDHYDPTVNETIYNNAPSFSNRKPASPDAGHKNKIRKNY